jgi:GTP cyclohydrolase I
MARAPKGPNAAAKGAIPPVDRAKAAQAIDNFLAALGRDVTREPHLAGTGRRVTDAFVDKLCSGYDIDVDALLTEHSFRGRSGVVALRRIAVSTMCPHHLLPARGVASVAFAPRTKLVGIGAIADLVDACARRLELQESITAHIADALERAITPHWVAVRLELEHACMQAIDPRSVATSVVTVATHGRTKASREEAFAWITGSQ